MFYEYDDMVDYLRTEFPAMRKQIRGMSDFIEAFTRKTDYVKPAIFVVPVTDEVQFNQKLNCKACVIEDFFDLVTVAACSGDASAYTSSRASRTLRSQLFSKMLEYPVPPNTRLQAVSGAFMRADETEYWWADRYKLIYPFN